MWTPASYGKGKRHFYVRQQQTNATLNSSNGRVRWFATFDAAQRAADLENGTAHLYSERGHKAEIDRMVATNRYTRRAAAYEINTRRGHWETFDSRTWRD